MNDDLAKKLLANVMGWDPEGAKDLRILQDLASIKYDEYQQFTTGLRFIESLASWLSQFDFKDRQTAYEFVLNRLVFISNAEMHHLVSISFPDYIRPLLVREVARQSGISEVFSEKLVNSKEYSVLLRQSLFLGLSDGAHIDVFRRSSSRLSNEQVWQTYDISKKKASDLSGKLKKDLQAILEREPNQDECKFQTFFLIDDFSASGISYLRYEDNSFKGKITQFLSEESELRKIVDFSKLKVFLVLYVATEKAKSYLDQNIKQWASSMGITCEVIVIQLLPHSFALSEEHDGPFIELLRKYFDEDIMDEHYRKGKCDQPYLGFDECGLPLVLFHNTPNNSVPLLWFDDQKKFRGLFPRMSRHRQY